MHNTSKQYIAIRRLYPKCPSPSAHRPARSRSRASKRANHTSRLSIALSSPIGCDRVVAAAVGRRRSGAGAGVGSDVASFYPRKHNASEDCRTPLAGFTTNERVYQLHNCCVIKGAGAGCVGLLSSAERINERRKSSRYSDGGLGCLHTQLFEHKRRTDSSKNGNLNMGFSFFYELLFLLSYSIGRLQGPDCLAPQARLTRAHEVALQRETPTSRARTFFISACLRSS